MSEFGPTWMRLVKTFKACFEIYDGTAFTIQTKSKNYEFGPYVQAQWLDDEIEIEITSNQYLRPNLSGLYQQRMEFLGWNLPDEDDHPNYWISIPNTRKAKCWAAKQWVRTLRMVYQLPVSAQIEISPVNMAVHVEASKHLFKLARPMCFTMIPIAQPKRATLLSGDKSKAARAKVFKPATKPTDPTGGSAEPARKPAPKWQPDPETPNALEPTAENFPDLFGPLVPDEGTNFE